MPLVHLMKPFILCGILVSLAATEQPAFHRIAHIEEINSERVFISELLYDSLGRRVSQTNGILNPAPHAHRHDSIRQTSVTTIRYAGDSIIYTSAMANGAAPTVWVVALDSLGNYISAGSQVTYDARGYIAAEITPDQETHIVMHADDVAERYGWSRRAGRVMHYKVSYTYYDSYDTRSHGTSAGRKILPHLIRTSVYSYSTEDRQDTIIIDYSYDYGTDGRILTEKRIERRSSTSHPDYWTVRYTYLD